MKFTLTFLLALCTNLTAMATPAVSSAPGADSLIAPPASMTSQTPKLSALSYLLYDYNSQQVLLEYKGHERVEPASLTKLMTAYVSFMAIKLNQIALSDKVSPSALAIRSQPAESRMFLNQKTKVSISDLLKGLIVVSANDAARTLAEKLAGNEAAFSGMMNKEAARLGMLNTHFANATGLPDPLHYSSAYDLALLAAALLQDFPEYLAFYSQREFEYNSIKHFNRNRLLWLDPYVDGMKTGHAESSGYSLVASAVRNNHRMIAVVLGTNSDQLRSSESQRLLNHGYQDYEIFYLYGKNEAISKIRLWKGTENAVEVGLRGGLTVTLPKGQREKLKANIETDQPLMAPISDGQQIGILKLTYDGKPYLDFPLVALEPVALVNIFSRGIDSIRMIFSK